MRRLTPRQLRFVTEYVISGSAALAARNAGYSEKWADRAGHKLVENDRVREEINRQVRESLSHRNVTKERVLTELARIAFADLADLASWEAGAFKIKDASEIGEGKTAVIQEMRIRSGQNSEIKIKLFDKVRALGILLDYLTLTEPSRTEQKMVLLKFPIVPIKQVTGVVTDDENQKARDT